MQCQGQWQRIKYKVKVRAGQGIKVQGEESKGRFKIWYQDQPVSKASQGWFRLDHRAGIHGRKIPGQGG